MIKPAKEGFFKDNQLAKDIIIPEIITLKTKSSTLKSYPKKFLILEIGFLNGS